MIELDHPFFFLEPLFSTEEAVFHFSRYVHTPDTLFDHREPFVAAADDLSQEWIEESVSRLRSDQEIALHSQVTLSGRKWHIPMIDFAATELTSASLDRIRLFIPKKVFLASAFYRTGRSFHAYSTQLLAPKEWIEFMGRLLLINQSQEESIIDTRWVGHRLIAGYGALRLSNNSGQYLGMPRRVEIRSIVDKKNSSSAEEDASTAVTAS